MRRCMVGIFKGGCGKTTIAATVAIGLARRGFRVVLADLDPQSSCTDLVGLRGYEGPNVRHLIMEGVPIREVLVEVEPNMFLVPGSKTLGRAEAWISTQVARERIVEKRLSPIIADFVVMDTSPAFSFLNVACLYYATEVWIPVVYDYLVLVGLEQFRETLDLVDKELGHSVPVRYLIPNRYDERPILSRAIHEKLIRTFGEEVFTNPIRSSVKVGEAASNHSPIYDYEPNHKVSADFLQLIGRVAGDSEQRKEL